MKTLEKIFGKLDYLNRKKIFRNHYGSTSSYPTNKYFVQADISFRGLTGKNKKEYDRLCAIIHRR